MIRERAWQMLAEAHVGLDVVWERGTVCRGAYITNSTGMQYMTHSGGWTDGINGDDNFWNNLTEAADFLRAMKANVSGEGREAYPAPACSGLPPCALCGRTEYPVEYGPGQNILPAGILIGFDNGGQVWICRRCSRDPAALERLETDARLKANAPAVAPQSPPAGGSAVENQP